MSSQTTLVELLGFAHMHDYNASEIRPPAAYGGLSRQLYH